MKYLSKVNQVIFSSLPIYSSSYEALAPTGFLDILLTMEKRPNLQRAITHEMFFSEFIQKLIRSSTHHYQSIH